MPPWDQQPQWTAVGSVEGPEGPPGPPGPVSDPDVVDLTIQFENALA